MTDVPRGVLVQHAQRLFELAEALDWRSYDPYDVLLSPVGGRLAQRSAFAARLLLQVGKHSGTGLRRVLRVPPHEEAKALADFLQASVALVEAGESWPMRYVAQIAERLRTSATRTDSGIGWGLAFPWVSRFGAMPAGEPNIYTTTVVCHALLDDYWLTGRSESALAALEGTSLIVTGLGSFEHRGREWLRYNVGSSTPIVNVQASAAGLFARMNEVRPQEKLLAFADRAAAVVLAAQRPDGSWPYSDDSRGRFVDGFHTGFALEGLVKYLRHRGADRVPGVAGAVELGFSYFKAHLLTPDGYPRGVADGRASEDGQTVAQAIETLITCGKPDDLVIAARIWRSSRDGGILERPFAALRWTLGPFVAATASLVRGLST